MKYALVVIGASLGGLRAMQTILSALPADFRLPVALVQHRPQDAGDELAFVLRKHCALPLHEVEDKTAIGAGAVYIAPPGYHLLVDGDHFALSTEAPVLWARPSIDILFESAAEAFGPRLIGVTLTGTGQDGALGLTVVHRHGGMALVESPETAHAKEMPQAAIAMGRGKIQLELEAIGPYLVELSLKE
ncbi:MAG: chemotaxis protein CheB [Nitrosomonadaceae bacterium]|nr:chemotaxis protein CheB [Nitrosomonadaceae bacterium]